MPAPWPMPSHITRLLAAPALMMLAAAAETPSAPTIGSFCTPSSSASTLRSFGCSGGVLLGQFRHCTRSSAPTVPNCGYSLPQPTTSSRTRSGGGRPSAAAHELTNRPSLPRGGWALLIRLFSRLTSPERAVASALARSLVLPTRSAVG